MTPNDIIALALKTAGVVGVGQTPLAEDTADALTSLNMMLAQWARRRWLVYHLRDVAIVATGAGSYSIGPGAAIDVPRLDRVESAYVRYLNGSVPVDYPLTVIASREDWSRISFKSQPGVPAYVFLDSNFPLGTLFVWPVPLAGAYEIHLLVKDDLTSVPDLVTDIQLPPEYLEALHFCLAQRLRALYRLPPDPSVNGLARAALATVRSANVQVASLTLPAALVRSRGYNILTDR